jgi:hypothetical protein
MTQEEGRAQRATLGRRALPSLDGLCLAREPPPAAPPPYPTAAKVRQSVAELDMARAKLAPARSKLHRGALEASPARGRPLEFIKRGAFRALPLLRLDQAAVTQLWLFLFSARADRAPRTEAPFARHMGSRWSATARS